MSENYRELINQRIDPVLDEVIAEHYQKVLVDFLTDFTDKYGFADGEINAFSVMVRLTEKLKERGYQKVETAWSLGLTSHNPYCFETIEKNGVGVDIPTALKEVVDNEILKSYLKIVIGNPDYGYI